jgi:hypothetical protein
MLAGEVRVSRRFQDGRVLACRRGIDWNCCHEKQGAVLLWRLAFYRRHALRALRRFAPPLAPPAPIGRGLRMPRFRYAD